ncbi:short-chain alcohol dehydrogenase [Rhizodiscina lignyota]|uniref:Short-chain alcohol dehydrogenase n=1 Tax=Rhizodiscina lignyota TaxID=1504668 RepID=A0A9P4I954_9PEZI|nr:short-chain alcohol dehydrogenase [Rhizodiscina lignyota]
MASRIISRFAHSASSGAASKPLVISISGAASGFGALAARSLARAGHTVYAGIRNAQPDAEETVQSINSFSKEHNVNLRAVEQDVVNQDSVNASIDHIIKECGKIDCIIHNAGHMVYGPTEAFTPEQLAGLYDINVLSTQRLSRAALPHMRKARSGLVLWVSSSSVLGGTPPFLAPYFAAKAGMDSLAVSYQAELSQWGIETSIIVPGAFTKGTNHFLTAGQPADENVTKEYTEGPYKGVPDGVNAGLASLEPEDASVQDVAGAIVDVVGLPRGQRPYRVFIDPSQDGSEIVSGMRDRVRRELYWRIGKESLLKTKLS